MGIASNPPLRGYYVGVALFAAALVFAGFAPTYYLSPAFDGPALAPMVHVHGAVFTLWMLLFGAQTTLVAVHRTDLHRRLGIVAAAVAAIMVALGSLTAIAAAQRGHTPLPEVPPLAFLVMPIGDMAVFAVLVAAGIVARRRRDIHARLMLLATVSILGPAIARLRLDLVQDNNPIAFMLGVTLIVVACAAIDAVRQRRLHPVFLWAGLFVVLSQPLRLLLARTEAWMAFATCITA